MEHTLRVAKSRTSSVVEKLHGQLIELEKLLSLIRDLREPYLDMVCLYYFSPSEFEPAFLDMIGRISEEKTYEEMNVELKGQLVFLISESRLPIQPEDVLSILEVYVEALLSKAELVATMWSSRGVLRSELYWVLTFAAGLAINLNHLYSWALKQALEVNNEQERNNDKALYYGLCLYYLVKGYMSSRLD